MTRSSPWWMSLPLLFALTACREFELPQVAHSSTSQTREYQNGPLCGRDQHPLVPITNTVPLAKETVLAGFRSDFFPGAQPFPCNRLKLYQSQGTMLFSGDVPPGIPLAVITALIEISEFRPTVPLRVTEARPVATAVSGGYSGATRTSCRFRVRHIPGTGYTPSSANYGGDWVATEELTDAGTDRFWVPLRNPPLVNVTEEFRRSVSGGRVNMRLAIEPDDRAMPSGASNNCYGQFTVRLRLLAPDE